MKKKQPTLRILKKSAYKEANYFIQQIGDIYQCVLFFQGEFYQFYNIITPNKGTKTLDEDQLMQLIGFTEDMMIATVEEIYKKLDPDYQLSPEQQMGEQIIEIIEEKEAQKDDKAIN